LQLHTTDLKPGDVLGRYQLLLPIAESGKSQIWAARQRGHGGFQKVVAVKTIPRSAEDASNLEAMLFDEASLASLVRHPNVAETLDLGEREDGTLYLVTEWVNGESLDNILRASRSVGGIPMAIAVHLIIEACKGLHAAHVTCNAKGDPLGIVHRAVSLQNMLVTYSGAVKLIDFSVAKATQHIPQTRATGQAPGKLNYVPPEQVHGDKLDARTDVFAMGIVLYRITAGAHPFQSGNNAAKLVNVLSRRAVPPSAVVANYPKTLEAVVMKALARDRDQRFESARAMVLALQQSLPAIVQANSEKNTEVFMQRLFAKRIVERQEALLDALLVAEGTAQMLALGRDGTKEVCTVSSMSAVSVETGEGPDLVTDRPPTIVSLVPNRGKRRIAFVAMAAGIAGAIGASAFRQAPGSAPVAAAMVVPVWSPPAVSPRPPVVVQEQPAPVDQTQSPVGAASVAALASAEAALPGAAPTKKRGSVNVPKQEIDRR
jgi:eukaryotic-like serine/threonine-protein kinase